MAKRRPNSWHEEGGEELSKEKIEQNPAGHVQKHVGEMEAKLVGIPKKIVKDVRDVLDRTIVCREGIEEEVVSECFENEERTLDKRILVGKIEIIPDAFPLQSRRARENSDQK